MRHQRLEFTNYCRMQTDIDESYVDCTDEEMRSLEGESCSICFDEFDSAPSKKLRCDHFFHKKCLLSWLERKPIDEHTCPLCRQPSNEHSIEAAANRDAGMTPVNATGPDGADIATAAPAPAMNPRNTVNTRSNLFRLSTDMLPSWLPIPNVAFEVVRSEVAQGRRFGEILNRINASEPGAMTDEAVAEIRTRMQTVLEV